MRTSIIPLALAAALLAAGCGKDAGTRTDAHAEPAAEAADHAGHDHDHAEGEVEASDLDQPVEALFAASCEHDLKTFACDECRYEVGVARAPADLFTGGLLHTAMPTREPVRSPLTLTGEVKFDERRVAHLAPPADGIVSRVRVAVGDRVRRGDVLVEIESGEAAQAAAELREAQSRLELADQAFERARALREQDIAPEKDLRQAEQELESARIRLETARAQASRLGAPVDQADATGSANLLRLRAPADGTVLFLHAVGGEPARTGEVMATVGDIAVIWVWADLYERDLARLAPAPLPAEVLVRAWPGQTFAGTVDFISPSIDEASRTVKLRVTVT